MVSARYHLEEKEDVTTRKWKQEKSEDSYGTKDNEVSEYELSDKGVPAK